jgi:hypothetical protein
MVTCPNRTRGIAMNIAQALKHGLSGKPVVQLRWQFTCPSCGMDNGGTNRPPLRAMCVGSGCWTEIEAEENPEWRPSASLTSTANCTDTTGDQKAEFVSKMLLTKIEAE